MHRANEGSRRPSTTLVLVFRHLPLASRLVASCSASTSTPSDGSCTYRTTDPRMKQFFTDACTRAREGADVSTCGFDRDVRARLRSTCFHAYHVRMFRLVCDVHVVQLEVEELVDGMQASDQRQVVLQLHRHLSVDHARRQLSYASSTTSVAPQHAPAVPRAS